jgi:drug/metabolite transporter (DMT)-like permease
MRSSKFLNWILFALICFIWGSSFILMKLGLYDRQGQPLLSAYQVAALRILSAGIILAPFSFGKYKNIPRRSYGYLLLSGLFSIFLPAFLFCLAETRISSALTGTLNSLTPFFVIITGFILFRQKIPARQILGIIVGLGGVTALFISGSGAAPLDPGYSGLVIVATLCYALNANIVRYKLKAIPSLDIAACSFGILILPAILILYYTHYFSLPLMQGAYLKATTASCVLGVFGSALAWFLFYILVKRTSAVFASSVTYVLPFVAMAWAWVYGESVTVIQIICLLIILAGVYFSSPDGQRLFDAFSRRKKQPGI